MHGPDRHQAAGARPADFSSDRMHDLHPVADAFVASGSPASGD